MVERMLDEQGEETRTPHDENFVIVPPQLVLLPKQSQTVRVQWRSQERTSRGPGGILIDRQHGN